MSFKVGTPTLALKMEKVKQFNERKHGLAEKILEEAGEERYSRSRTFDRSRAGLNDYSGGMFSSGSEAFEHLQKAWAEADEVHRANSKSHRGLRKDKDVAFALIVKPPAEWANEQDAETLDRFFEDFHDEMTAAGIFKDENVLIRARHRDEAGEHEHYVFMLDRTPEGDLGDGLNYWFKPRRKGDPKSSFHDALNHDIPRAMQARGWDVAESTNEDAYDPQKAAEMTPEERDAYSAECVAKKKAKRHGKSVNEYIADKRAEEANEAAEKAIERAAEATALAAEAEAARKEAAAELDDMEPTLKKGRAELASMDVDKAKARAEKEAAEKEAEAAKKERQRAFDEKLAMGRSLTQVKTNVDRREKQLADLDETIAARTAAVQQREAEAARKETETERKLREAEELADKAQQALDDAQEQADGAFAFFRSFIETRLRKREPKFLASMLTWVGAAQKAYAQRTETTREQTTSVRRSVNVARSRSTERDNGLDF